MQYGDFKIEAAVPTDRQGYGHSAGNSHQKYTLYITFSTLHIIHDTSLFLKDSAFKRAEFLRNLFSALPMIHEQSHELNFRFH